MKKSIIAAGAASVALAAMPILGVFAEGSASVEVVDTVTATVNKGCTITRTGAEADFSDSLNISVTAGNASTGTDHTKAVSIVCSDSGWNLTATGTGDHATYLYRNNDTKGSIAAGTGAAGAASSWAYKVEYHVGGTANTKDWGAITDSAASVISDATSNTGDFTPYYRVYAQADQPAGSYKGEVTYTITAE